VEIDEKTPWKEEIKRKTMKRKWGKICKENLSVQTNKIVHTNYKSHYFLNKNLSLTE